jgi:hypothetical protein
MDTYFEHYNEDKTQRLSDLEIKAAQLEDTLFDLHESLERELAESEHAREAAGSKNQAAPRRATQTADLGSGAGRRSAMRMVPNGDSGRRSGGSSAGRAEEQTDLRHAAGRRSAPRTAPKASHGYRVPTADGESPSADERTQILINRGRRSVDHGRRWSGRRITVVTAIAIVLVTIVVILFARGGPSWPASVAAVKNEISTACQNPNVASEPGQVNFACATSTSQILWVFSLMTSGDNASFADAKSGRKGLEPITPSLGGEVALSLDLHHPYNPYDPIDSLQVAARAINNIIAGATLTDSNGNPVVQPGLESDPANCARYTGSPAIVSRAGFPSMCALPVTSQAGQAALVADVFQDWVVGASPTISSDAAVLFENASNPGDPQVQAILKSLAGAGQLP